MTEASGTPAAPGVPLTSQRSLPCLNTARLLLRPWQDTDLAPFAALNADARVAQYLPGTLTRAQSDELAARLRSYGRSEGDGNESNADDVRSPSIHGLGVWALERVDHPCTPFIGFVGLTSPRFQAPFTPCVEISWRLSAEHWGQGLATEGAAAVLHHGFRLLRLSEVVSFTVSQNLASRRVMEKIGLQRVAQGDFDHPTLPPGHPLRRHVLYRLSADAHTGKSRAL